MKKQILFASSVFIAGLCSIVYELLISTAATYFLGNGVKQFSLIIGFYLFSMGIGAYFSKFFSGKPLHFFIKIEYALGFIGGISVPLIYFLFVTIPPGALQILCLVIVFVIGLLTGMEVPLLTFARTDSFKNNLSQVLSLDYIGGLFATLLFPFILLPFVGLFYSSLIFGMLNLVLGIVLNIVYYPRLKRLITAGLIVISVLLVGILYAGKLLSIWEGKIYKHPVVFNEQTSYQKIVLTKRREEVRLFLDRVIQFSSLDEHRYHESLVHTPVQMHHAPKRVLVLGGGENLASRELLKYPQIKQIDVVDIDPMMFQLSKENPHLLAINEGAANHPKVNLIAEDAFTYLNRLHKPYDIIIADLPDPANESIARLYSTQFYLLAKSNLAPDGLLVTQAGEIYFANTVFSCINNTLSKVFNHVKTYHAYIPSFGDWGFVVVSDQPLQNIERPQLPADLKYLTPGQLKQAFVLPHDISIARTKINSLDSPIILNYYLDDWEKWKQDLTGEPISGQ